MITHLTLVRHGETDWNVAGRIQGHTDIPLNATGKAQAIDLAEALAGNRFDQVWCSDLLRTRQTLAPLLELSSARRLPVVHWEPRLRERHFGRLQGMSREQIRRDEPDASARLAQRDPDDDLGGGESLTTFHARCAAVLVDIVRAGAGRQVLVVTHGGVLDALYRTMCGIELNVPRAWGLRNAALNRVSAETLEAGEGEPLARTDDSVGMPDTAAATDPDSLAQAGAAVRYEVLAWDDTSHLAGSKDET